MCISLGHAKWCTRPGRCNCLTFDADAKTCRDVCECRVGNELVLQGHGMVELGCTETPAHGSTMCKAHTLRAAMPHELCGACDESPGDVLPSKEVPQREQGSGWNCTACGPRDARLSRVRVCTRCPSRLS